MMSSRISSSRHQCSIHIVRLNCVQDFLRIVSWKVILKDICILSKLGQEASSGLTSTRKASFKHKIPNSWISEKNLDHCNSAIKSVGKYKGAGFTPSFRACLFSFNDNQKIMCSGRFVLKLTSSGQFIAKSPSTLSKFTECALSKWSSQISEKKPLLCHCTYWCRIYSRHLGRWKITLFSKKGIPLKILLRLLLFTPLLRSFWKAYLQPSFLFTWPYFLLPYSKFTFGKKLFLKPCWTSAT